jgi:hypothetical protein
MAYIYDYSENYTFSEWWHKLRYEYQIYTLKLNYFQYLICIVLNIPNWKVEICSYFVQQNNLSISVMFYWIGLILISYLHIHENCMWGSADCKLFKARRKEILPTDYRFLCVAKLKWLKCTSNYKFYGTQNRSMGRICLFSAHSEG